jgi:hypothetical protein
VGASFTTHAVAFAPPSAELIARRDDFGNALLVWRQGPDPGLPASDIFRMRYTAGGTFGLPINLSQSDNQTSHGPLVGHLGDSGRGQVFWLESVPAPGLDDIHYAQTPAPPAP